ncbi:unnamed protein product [Sphagnum jensenii]
MDQEKELVLALRAQMLEPQNCLEQVQRLFLLHNCEVRECKCFPLRERRRQQQQQEEEEEEEGRRDKEDEDDEGPDGFGDQIWT